MRLFHDEEDGDPEPVAGLPEKLPEGETILWQGKPDAATLAVQTFRMRLVAAYFAISTVWRVANIVANGGGGAEIVPILATSAVGFAAAMALLFGMGWLMARAAIYTITSKRVVLRYGAAIRKYVNIPFAVIQSASMKQHQGGAGSIALVTNNTVKIAYLQLWPFARPLRFVKPQPMLRALPEAANVAAVLARAMKANAPAAVEISAAAKERESCVIEPRPQAAVA